MRWSPRSPIILVAAFCNIVTVIVFVSLIERAVPVDAKRVSFDGYRLYRIHPTTFQHHEILSKMGNERGYSFWGKLGSVVNWADVMVSPGKLADFEKLVVQQHMDVEELMNDVQRFIDQENPLGNSHDVFGWSSYHDLDDINGWMDNLDSEYPDFVTPLVGLETYEGRSIRGVKLSFRQGNPGVFLEGGIHPREWISPAVVTYILNELITSTDPSVREVAKSYDWYIFPVCNPDGYVYTHETDRLWRKTTKPYAFGCIGADLNRNWDCHWNESGASSCPCDENFAGDQAFSEIESKTLSEFITSVKSHIFAYISFHNYGQQILLPYGYTEARVANYADLMQIGNVSASALAKRYGTQYNVGSIPEILYASSGIAMDWVHEVLNIPITFTYELRDQGYFAFTLPADQIIPTGEETLDSLIALLQEAKRLGYGSNAFLPNEKTVLEGDSATA